MCLITDKRSIWARKKSRVAYKVFGLPFDKLGRERGELYSFYMHTLARLGQPMYAEASSRKLSTDALIKRAVRGHKCWLVRTGIHCYKAEAEARVLAGGGWECPVVVVQGIAEGIFATNQAQLVCTSFTPEEIIYRSSAA